MKRKPNRKERLKARVRVLWRDWGKPFLIVVVVLSTFRSAVADWNDVPTGSMKPTILEGDRIFVNKLAYDLKLPFTRVCLLEWGGPDRGDIVILFSPTDGTRLVKRIVAIPGDRVELRNSRLYVNNVAATYSSLDQAIISEIDAAEQPKHRFASEQMGDQAHAVMFTPAIRASRTFAPVTLPPDKFFVMGDNRDNSGDSRLFGFADRRSIVGRVSRVVLSLDPEHHYMPRWHRWLKALD